MRDPHPWHTGIGLFVFVVLPVALAGWHYSTEAPARAKTTLAKTKIETTPTKPIQIRRPRIISVENATEPEPHQLQLPDETIRGHDQ